MCGANSAEFLPGLYAARAGCGKLSATEETLEGPMVREIELLAVSLVFVFLGACVFGVIH